MTPSQLLILSAIALIAVFVGFVVLSRITIHRGLKQKSRSERQRFATVLVSITVAPVAALVLTNAIWFSGITASYDWRNALTTLALIGLIAHNAHYIIKLNALNK